VSDDIAELRLRHALATERINHPGANPSHSTEALPQAVDGASPTTLETTARKLWKAKLVQIHTAALLEGVELYPVNDEGQCSDCRIHIHTLQQMQQDRTTLADQPW
jgi:hypothetical protein